MSINPKELIHTFVTRPQENIIDDGQGNYNISPIGFPNVNKSEDTNPTLFIPNFVINRDEIVVINYNVSPLNGLHSFTENQKVKLTSQTNANENGIYIVKIGEWEKIIEYEYDGSENDNKEGIYEDKYLNHFRKGYSYKEVSDFIKNRLENVINFGVFSKNRGNGKLINWFFSTSDIVNIGGSKTNQSVYIESFGKYITKNKNEEKKYYDKDKISFLKELKKRENKLARWSLSNHHTEALQGRNKSPFVRDYPFKYNTKYEDTIFSGGMVELELSLDEWRFRTQNSTTTILRPLCESSLFYQRENGYHNNITLDMSKNNVFGRHHISILHHLDRYDYAPNNPDVEGDGTNYVEYRGDILVSELDSISTPLNSGLYVLYKNVSNNIIKYHYIERKKNSVTIEEYGVGVWSPNNLLWEDGGNNILRIYITPTDYVEFWVNNKPISWVLNKLVEHNELIPVPFNIPNNNIDKEEFLKNTNVLFIYNTLIDQSQEVHQKEKIRSKKTFIHLPTPIDLVDGQQIEIDVSLPMISDQEAFKFNTIGSLSGYKNYITQPRVQVFSGVQKCYDKYTGIIKNKLKVYSINKVGTEAIITSYNHGIDGNTKIYLYECSDFRYNGLHNAIVLSPHELSITVPNEYDNMVSGYGERWVYIKDIKISSINIVSSIATLTTINQHGIIDAEDILIKLSGNGFLNGVHRAYVVDDKTIAFSISSYDLYIPGNEYTIESIEIAHSVNFEHDALLDLPDVVSIIRNGSTARIEFSKKLMQYSGESVRITISGCIENEFNGEYDGIISNDGIEYQLVNIPTELSASGDIKLYAFMKAEDMGFGDYRSLSGESVEGLTERDNQYLFSVMPDVEFATETSLYHQPPMKLSDIKSPDKRVLLANIYPTSLNTFSWRIDKDPQLKLLKESLLATTSVNGSATYYGYLANKFAYDKIKPFLDSARMSLFDSPIAYDYDVVDSVNDDTFDAFLLSRVRVLMQENVVPDESQILSDELSKTYGSIVYQAKKAFHECINTFLSTRIGVRNINTTEQNKIENDIGLSFIGFNDNGNHINDTIVGGFSSLIKFNNGVYPVDYPSNSSRWLNKAIYTPKLAVNATGLVNLINDNVFHNVNPLFKLYLEPEFGETPISSNSDDRYIPHQLNSLSSPQFEFGIGKYNSIYNFLEKSGVSQSIKNDFILSLHDWVSLIPNTPINGVYGENRDVEERFNLQNINNNMMFSFYRMHLIPFSKIFSTDFVCPVENVFVNIDNFTEIISNNNLSTLLLESVKSNPILMEYCVNIISGESISSSYENTFMGINSLPLKNSSIQQNIKNSIIEYFRNFLSGYSNNMPIRFYNSFRIGIYGDLNSMDGYEHDYKMIWLNSLKNYVEEYIDVLPNELYPKYIDDNFYLINKPLTNIIVNDSNESHLMVRGKGKSAIGKIIVDDWSELIDDGFAKININGVIITATTTQTNDDNYFFVDNNDISTATNIVNIINNSSNPLLKDIHADNYGGYSNVITLTVSKKLGSLGNSFVLDFIPSSSGNSGITIIPFSGGEDSDNKKLLTNISISGQQYLADRDFYLKTMRSSYIRIKMKFVFSSICGRWLLLDYRQCPTSYLNPGIGNKTFSAKGKSIVKRGKKGLNPDDYLFVTDQNFNTINNVDYLWVLDECFDANQAYKQLWCVPYNEMKPMEFNRFCLPFMCQEFPYDENGKLKSSDSLSNHNTFGNNQNFNFVLMRDLKNIGFMTPHTVNGDDGGKSVIYNMPHPWALYWHKRPASSIILDGFGEIPSPFARTGGFLSDPSLHNMFDFPCRINLNEDPCYLIPWHEDMNYDWLMNKLPSIDSSIIYDVNRTDKIDIDAIMENYDWQTNSPIDIQKPLDKQREGFLEIDSTRPIE